MASNDSERVMFFSPAVFDRVLFNRASHFAYDSFSLPPAAGVRGERPCVRRTCAAPDPVDLAGRAAEYQNRARRHGVSAVYGPNAG